MLPFKLSPELNAYSPDVGERVLQKPVISSGKYTLFMQFKRPTQKVLRYETKYLSLSDLEKEIKHNEIKICFSECVLFIGNREFSQ